ncbi:MAG: helix-turn-helix domain-containing protein [Gammaproteobacteria bacterium]|nr:helix-turn-helix domain-containing protein [Gammaproteobacteria bacterium]
MKESQPAEGHGASSTTPLDLGRSRCRSCQQRERCLPGTLGASQTQRFEPMVQRRRPLASGEHLFRVGDTFRHLCAVQSGCLKTYTIDAEGREHVMAFHFPGEVIGLDAVFPARHLTSCVALTGSQVCCLPYASLGTLTQEMPELQTQLLRMLSRDMLGAASIAGDYTANERLAGFLVMVAARLHRREPTPTSLNLAMSRQDIANYLRLAPETVSRILARFQKDGLVKADRRHIALLNPDGLAEIAACMNPYARFGVPQLQRNAAS